MGKNKIILVVIVVLFTFVLLGALSQPLGLTCENSRYFFGLGGIILGYFMGKTKVDKK